MFRLQCESIVSTVDMKVVLVGQTGCGKSSFLRYIAGQPFIAEHIPTERPIFCNLGGNIFIDCPSDTKTISVVLQNEAPDMVLVFIEHGFMSRALIAFVRLILADVKILRVFPKADVREVVTQGELSFSCKTGQGVGRIMDVVLERNLWNSKAVPQLYNVTNGVDV